MYKYTCFASLLAPLALLGQEPSTKAQQAVEVDSVRAVLHAFKFDPIQVVFGDFQLHYEQYMAPHWSAELGAGITRRNYAAGAFDYSLDNLSRAVEVRSSHSVSLAIRYYFLGSEELYGPYLALIANDRSYLTELQQLDSLGSAVGTPFTDRRPSTSVLLGAGINALPRKSNFFVDFYLGAGVKFKRYTIVRQLNEQGDLGYDSTSGRALLVQGGVRLGYGF